MSLMNMEYISSTVGPIPRTVSESALTLPFIMGVGEALSLRWPGSIKKGNRKSEILLRDAEVGADRALSWVDCGSDWSR